MFLKTGWRPGGSRSEQLRPCGRRNPRAPPGGNNSVRATGGRPAVDEIERIEVPFTQGQTQDQGVKGRPTDSEVQGHRILVHPALCAARTGAPCVEFPRHQGLHDLRIRLEGNHGRLGEVLLQAWWESCAPCVLKIDTPLGRLDLGPCQPEKNPSRVRTHNGGRLGPPRVMGFCPFGGKR